MTEKTDLKTQTMRLELPARDALIYMDKTDQTGAPWQMVGSANGVTQGYAGRHLTLSLWVDGADAPFKVTLRADGTWGATLDLLVP